MTAYTKTGGGLAPTHGHKKTHDHEGKADGVVPRAEFHHERDVRAGEVVHHHVQQARNDQGEHENLVPQRRAAAVDFYRGAVGGCTRGDRGRARGDL